MIADFRIIFAEHRAFNVKIRYNLSFPIKLIILIIENCQFPVNTGPLSFSCPAISAGIETGDKFLVGL